MAQWTQTLEPYIRVHEEVKTMAINPTAGEDLIIGVTFISDAGPSTPTLIRNQKEFLATYTSQDLSQEYIESLNQLYTGDDITLAATMWANAYRLAGSNTLLAVRASKANGSNYAKPLVKGDNNTYILKDGELLKRVPSFKLVIDNGGNQSNNTAADGWLMSVNGIGAFGNRVDDEGPQYDYYAGSLPELVNNLNDTTKFFSPSYTYYSAAEITSDILDEEDAESAVAVVFNEVYLSRDFLDTEDTRTVDGLTYLVTCQPDSTSSNMTQQTIRLNSTAYSHFTPSPYYATNTYNSATPLQVRIRRFNHDAVVSKTLTDAEKATLTANGKSPYVVLTETLDSFTGGGLFEPSDAVLRKDFYEVAVMDPSVNGEVSFFNIGNILGRGDMEASELNSLIKMVQVSLPDNMRDLGLNYYGYLSDDTALVKTTKPNIKRFDRTTVTAGTKPYKIFDSTDEMYNFFSNDLREGAVVAAPKVDASISHAKNSSDEQNEEPTIEYVYNFNAYTDDAGEHLLSDGTFEIIKDETITIDNAEYVKLNILSNTLVEGQTNDISERTFYILSSALIDGETLYQLYDPEANEGEGDLVNIWIKMSEIINREDKDKVEYDYYAYTGTNTYSSKSDLETYISSNTPRPGAIFSIGNDTTKTVTNYEYNTNGSNQFFVDLTIHSTGDDPSAILDVSDSDLKRAMDQILEDEVYVTEGLSDLGNTELSFQSYLANMAISETGNYFYPISTVNSTNYMTIGNSATKISQDSYKLYMSAPWDIDTGTLGWKFYASPSVLYWEAVARNRRNNNEFASLLGQSYGLVQYQRPTTEFNKKTRQLLLSRRVNTAYWNISTQAWNMNDCYTKENENNIMNEDGNSRLMIRISKAMPVILRQFIGRKITEPMCKEVVGVIDYFFRTTIIPMNVSVDGYQIFCDYDEALARQNKIKVVVNCRYQRSLKYIEVYNRAFDVGMDITNPN